ncbi:MAG: glycosyltransferase family 4 protein [Cyanobacteria bacterium P01_D01_bin.1]
MRLKIAVIGSKGLPPHQGGIEHHCAQLYPRIVQAGHEVDLYARSSYSQSYSQPHSQLDRKSPAHSHHQDSSIQRYKGVRVITTPSIRVRGLDALGCSGMAAAIALTKRYDIVHYHALGPSLFTPFTHHFSSAKVITTCHGLDWQRAKWGKFPRWVIKKGEQAAVGNTNRLIVVSEALQDYFLAQYGKETTYIENAPIPYADSDASFSFGRSLGLEQDRYLLFVGRLVPEKRIDLLIKAFQRLDQTGWKLAIVGDNSDSSEFVLDLLRLASGRPDVVFVGELHGQWLAEIVRGAGLFVLPSDVEGLPLVLLEAMQEQIPVVVSDILVHRQVVGEEGGLTFTTGNEESLRHRLAWAIAHPRAMKQMAGRARGYVSMNYCWDAIASKYLAQYEMLVHRTVEPSVPIRASMKRP